MALLPWRKFNSFSKHPTSSLSPDVLCPPRPLHLQSHPKCSCTIDSSHTCICPCSCAAPMQAPADAKSRGVPPEKKRLYSCYITGHSQRAQNCISKRASGQCKPLYLMWGHLYSQLFVDRVRCTTLDSFSNSPELSASFFFL